MHNHDIQVPAIIHIWGTLRYQGKKKLDILFIPSPALLFFVTLYPSVLRQTLILLLFLVSITSNIRCLDSALSLTPKTQKLRQHLQANWTNRLLVCVFMKFYYLSVINTGKKVTFGEVLNHRVSKVYLSSTY